MKEYPNKFNHLIRYATKIANTEIRQIEKYMYRFDPTITRDVMTSIQLPKTYSEALSKTLKIKVFVKWMYGQA